MDPERELGSVYFSSNMSIMHTSWLAWIGKEQQYNIGGPTYKLPPIDTTYHVSKGNKRRTVWLPMY